MRDFVFFVFTQRVWNSIVRKKRVYLEVTSLAAIVALELRQVVAAGGGGWSVARFCNTCSAEEKGGAEKHRWSVHCSGPNRAKLLQRAAGGWSVERGTAAVAVKTATARWHLLRHWHSRRRRGLGPSVRWLFQRAHSSSSPFFFSKRDEPARLTVGGPPTQSRALVAESGGVASANTSLLRQVF